MNKRTLHRMFSVLAALAMGLSLLTGCGTKSAEQVQEQEDAQTIQVYLWTTGLYENYAPYIQAQLPDVSIEFIVGNNDLDFYKFLQQNGGLPDIITCCRFSLHDAAPLKDSLMNLALTNEAGAVYNTYLNSFKNEDGSVNWLPVCADARLIGHGKVHQAVLQRCRIVQREAAAGDDIRQTAVLLQKLVKIQIVVAVDELNVHVRQLGLDIGGIVFVQAGAPQIHLNSLSVFLLLCSFRIFFAASGEQG